MLASSSAGRRWQRPRRRRAAVRLVGNVVLETVLTDEERPSSSGAFRQAKRSSPRRNPVSSAVRWPARGGLPLMFTVQPGHAGRED
jgi:hypothetical protein